MRRLFIIGLLAAVGIGQAAIAHIAHTTAQGDAGGVSTSIINSTGATLLTATFGMRRGGQAPIITDNRGNTWRLAQMYTGEQTAAAIYYSYDKDGGALDVGAGHSLLIEFDGSNTQTVTFAAWSGTSGDAFEAASCSVATGTSISVIANPLVNNSIVLSVVGSILAEAYDSAPFTVLDGAMGDGASQAGGYTAYVIQTTATPVSSTWDYLTSGNLAVCTGVFRSAPTVSVIRRRVIE